MDHCKTSMLTCLFVVFCGSGWLTALSGSFWKCEIKECPKDAMECLGAGLTARGQLGNAKVELCESIESARFEAMKIYFGDKVFLDLKTAIEVKDFSENVQTCLDEGKICCFVTEKGSIPSIEACIDLWEGTMKLTLGDGIPLGFNEQEALFLLSLWTRNK
jgi:hypothetical protein